jgi:hypothetical protein
MEKIIRTKDEVEKLILAEQRIEVEQNNFFKHYLTYTSR